jgi:hypothetical protein
MELLSGIAGWRSTGAVTGRARRKFHEDARMDHVLEVPEVPLPPGMGACKRRKRRRPAGPGVG